LARCDRVTLNPVEIRTGATRGAAMSHQQQPALRPNFSKFSKGRELWF
jgi:hypothetical protein